MMKVEKRNNVDRELAVNNNLNDHQVSSTAIIDWSNREANIATAKS